MIFDKYFPLKQSLEDKTLFLSKDDIPICKIKYENLPNGFYSSLLRLFNGEDTISLDGYYFFNESKNTIEEFYAGNTLLEMSLEVKEEAQELANHFIARINSQEESPITDIITSPLFFIILAGIVTLSAILIFHNTSP